MSKFSKISSNLKVSDPISIVSHQLKNPISVLKTYIEVLLSEDIGKLNLKQEEYLLDCLSNVKRMAAIVTELLDVSKIEENKLLLKPARINLTEVVKRMADEFYLLTRASNAEIFFNAKEDFYVSVDIERIRGVLENIISNSIKYKYPQMYGKIEIELSRKDGSVEFICKDNGIGIPDEDIGKVFTKFYRSEEASTLDSTGTGLGLYINKAAIELSGGKIWFKNNKDKGVTFYFSLPLAD